LGFRAWGLGSLEENINIPENKGLGLEITANGNFSPNLCKGTEKHTSISDTLAVQIYPSLPLPPLPPNPMMTAMPRKTHLPLIAAAIISTPSSLGSRA
jgi:hypothetical protein